MHAPSSVGSTITPPRAQIIAVTMTNASATATATINVDDGKDCAIDREINVAVARLQTEAG